ncbi:MAG: class I SAM-dependent methyltransferase [Bacteroidota bacterium]
MLSRITQYLNRYQRKKLQAKKEAKRRSDRENYLQGGRVPWSPGYVPYKEQFIKDSLQNDDLLRAFSASETLNDFGLRLDERVVEYPWIFSNLPKDHCKLLDGGSTFNFDFIVNHPTIKNKDLTIFTFEPERSCFYKNKISYIYGDLRDMYLKDDSFDYVVSQSTIEHIDMDNSIYGYDIAHNEDANEKSFEYVKAIQEMIRILKPGGTLLLTFPFGKFENHGFFQQFDDEMLSRITHLFDNKGETSLTFFRYLTSGWVFCEQMDCQDIESFNPHTGVGKQDDGAAHCRSVCCIKFVKNDH